MNDLKKLIREVPDFPKPGINFYDITTLLKHPEGLRNTVDALAAEFEGERVDAVIGVEVNVFAPEAFDDLLAADQSAVRADQEDQEVHRDAF